MSTKRRRGHADGSGLVPTTGRDLLFNRISTDRHYPGDPRFVNNIRMLPEYVAVLGESSSVNAFLSDDLLDILLKEGAGKPPSSSVDGSVDKPMKLLGSTLTLRQMLNYVELLDGYEKKNGRYDVSHIVRKVRRMKLILADVFDLTGVKDQKLIIPIVQRKHFFVVVVNFNKRRSSKGLRSRRVVEKFISDVTIYDSMVGAFMTTTKEAAKEEKNSVLEIVKVINNFISIYILADVGHEMLRQTDEEVVDRLDFYSCPQQRNDIDCGLFCVGVVLHLLEDHVVDNTTFCHTDMCEMRKRLYTHFSQKVRNKSYNAYKHMIQQPTSVVVHDSYPHLRGSPRECNVPVPTPPPSPRECNAPVPAPPPRPLDAAVVSEGSRLLLTGWYSSTSFLPGCEVYFG